MTRRGRAWLAAVGSVAGFAVAFFLRMSAAYGPFNLSLQASDWMVVWDLWRHGQIGSGIVAESMVLGAGAATIPWVLWALADRKER